MIEQLAQASDKEAAKHLLCGRADAAAHSRLVEGRGWPPGAASAAPGLDACGVSSRGGKSQMKGHFAGHDP